MEQVGCLADTMVVEPTAVPAFNDLGHYTDVAPQQKVALARASAQGYNQTIAGLISKAQETEFDAFYEPPFFAQFVGQLSQSARNNIYRNFVAYGPQMMSDVGRPGLRLYADLQALIDQLSDR